MSNTDSFVKELANKHGRTRESLMPILQEIVNVYKFINEEAMINVARELDISAADVYGTASFYSFLEYKEMGKYVIRVCQTIVCDMKGKEEIIEALESTLRIKVGETTPDKKFTLLYTNCLGWCHKGPAMLINDDVHIELTPEKVKDIIATYSRK